MYLLAVRSGLGVGGGARGPMRQSSLSEKTGGKMNALLA